MAATVVVLPGADEPITGRDLIVQAAQIAARHLRANLHRLDADDPLRDEIEERSYFPSRPAESDRTGC